MARPTTLPLIDGGGGGDDASCPFLGVAARRPRRRADAAADAAADARRRGGARGAARACARARRRRAPTRRARRRWRFSRDGRACIVRAPRPRAAAARRRRRDRRDARVRRRRARRDDGVGEPGRRHVVRPRARARAAPPPSLAPRGSRDRPTSPGEDEMMTRSPSPHPLRGPSLPEGACSPRASRPTASPTPRRSRAGSRCTTCASRARTPPRAARR